jgi:hypothetical protein
MSCKPSCKCAVVRGLGFDAEKIYERVLRAISVAPPFSGNSLQRVDSERRFFRPSMQCAIGLPACRQAMRAAPGRRSFPFYERRRPSARVLSGDFPHLVDCARWVLGRQSRARVEARSHECERCTQGVGAPQTARQESSLYGRRRQLASRSTYTCGEVKGGAQ